MLRGSQDEHAHAMWDALGVSQNQGAAAVLPQPTTQPSPQCGATARCPYGTGNALVGSAGLSKVGRRLKTSRRRTPLATPL
jgi:hypothetical protein